MDCSCAAHVAIWLKFCALRNIVAAAFASSSSSSSWSRLISKRLSWYSARIPSG